MISAPVGMDKGALPLEEETKKHSYIAKSLKADRAYCVGRTV